ncbi:MAG: ferritin [candidate division NC10 bacterium]|jgi:ferritin|nr:ferritin [candidate division NC10 bacterium]
MLSKVLQDAINDQIKDEFYAAYLYLAMSAHFETVHLPGCARWMRGQSQEEASHAMKLFEFVHERGGRVVLHAIKQPPANFKSPLDAFQQALEHERGVTRMIHRLYELAAKENDYATQIMLQWFITEQVEEERSAGDIVEQLKMVGDQSVALFMLDKQLGARAGGE